MPPEAGCAASPLLVSDTPARRRSISRDHLVKGLRIALSITGAVIATLTVAGVGMHGADRRSVPSGDRQTIGESLARCASVDEERAATCQRVAVSAHAGTPLRKHEALVTASQGSSDPRRWCSGVAAELGTLHWQVDHRLPPYDATLSGCGGEFLATVFTAMIASAQDPATGVGDTVTSYCVNIGAGCWQVVTAALGDAGLTSGELESWCATFAVAEAITCRDSIHVRGGF